MIEDEEAQRYVNWILQGRSFACSTFDLSTSPATSTVVTKRGVSANSVVLTQAYSANASNADITRIVPGKGTFTVTHSASANTRTHRYYYVTGIR